MPVTTFSAHAPSGADDCWHMAPGFTGVAATPSGAFVVGACGVRLRIVGDRVEATSTPVVTMSMGGYGSCRAHRMHWSVAASSDRAAALIATPRCGPDPNAVWPNELERFDGRRWVRSTLKLGAPHDADVFAVSASPDGQLWAIVSGDDWHGPPANAVVRIDGSTIRELRPAIAPDLLRLIERAHADPASASALPNVVPYEHYAALAPVSVEEVWVAGALRQFVARNDEGRGEPSQHVAGAIWHRAADGTWSQRRVDDPELAAIAVGGDGTVVAGGGRIHRRSADGTWGELDGAPSHGITSVWVGGRDDVWLASACADERCRAPLVLHHDGTSLRRVALEPATTDASATPTAALASTPGGPVWLATATAVWRLDRPGRPR